MITRLIISFIIGRNQEDLNQIIVPKADNQFITANLRLDVDFAKNFKKISLEKRDQQLEIKIDSRSLKSIRI